MLGPSWWYVSSMRFYVSRERERRRENVCWAQEGSLCLICVVLVFSGLTTKEVNSLEIDMLLALDFDLNVQVCFDMSQIAFDI